MCVGVTKIAYQAFGVACRPADPCGTCQDVEVLHVDRGLQGREVVKTAWVQLGKEAVLEVVHGSLRKLDFIWRQWVQTT